jgi:hypothetical protein
LNVTGFEQPGKPWPSRLQWKLTVGSTSAKLKVALLELLGFGGPAMTSGGGDVVSTVHVYDVASLSVISASTAFTSNVWTPSLRAEYVTPLRHGAKPPPSSWHWNVTSRAASVNEKLAVVWLPYCGGPEMIVGAGGAAAVAPPAKGTPITRAAIAAA